MQYLLILKNMEKSYTWTTYKPGMLCLILASKLITRITFGYRAATRTAEINFQFLMFAFAFQTKVTRKTKLLCKIIQQHTRICSGGYDSIQKEHYSGNTSGIHI